MTTTFAEQYVGTENIHKEDAEGEHYQGGEGALSQVIDLAPVPAPALFQPICCSGMISGAGQWIVSFAIKVRESLKVENYSFLKRRGLANRACQDSHLKVNPQSVSSLLGA